jgi:hypothetical protein
MAWLYLGGELTRIGIEYHDTGIRVISSSYLMRDPDPTRPMWIWEWET